MSLEDEARENAASPTYQGAVARLTGRAPERRVDRTYDAKLITAMRTIFAQYDRELDYSATRHETSAPFVIRTTLATLAPIFGVDTDGDDWVGELRRAVSAPDPAEGPWPHSA